MPYKLHTRWIPSTNFSSVDPLKIFPLFTSATDRLFKPFKEHSKEKYAREWNEIYLDKMIRNAISTRNYENVINQITLVSLSFFSSFSFSLFFFFNSNRNDKDRWRFARIKMFRFVKRMCLSIFFFLLLFTFMRKIFTLLHKATIDKILIHLNSCKCMQDNENTYEN